MCAGDLNDISGTHLTGPATLLVGQLSDDVVTMVALREIDRTTCAITRTCMAPHAQSRGYGKAILRRPEAIARSHGYRRATLVSGPNQHLAVDLYNAADYTITEAEEHGALISVRMSELLQTFTDPG